VAGTDAESRAALPRFYRTPTGGMNADPIVSAVVARRTSTN
jgi:hypothetical protein